jgi:hypothetical protein
VLPRILPLYPDELLYSWVARTGNLLNFRYRQDLVRYVFGHEDARPKVDLPNRLGFVAEASGNRLGNAYDLLAKTSLFPFYSPFLRAESRERIIAALIGNLGVAANKANALSMLRLEIPQSLRYCAECWAEDKEEKRPRYWRRSHQCLGVFVCHAHGAVLSWSPVKWARREAVTQFVPAEALPPRAGRALSVKGLGMDVLLRLARNAYWLLNENQAAPGPLVLARAYTSAFAARGLIRPNGHVMGITASWVRKKIGEKLLRKVGCYLPDGHSWLFALVRSCSINRGVQPPLRHLLVMAALDLDAKDFFAAMQKPTVLEQSLRRARAQAVTPSPKPLRLDADREQVVTWWSEASISVGEMARRLRVASDTVTLFATRIGLPFPRNGKKGTTWAKHRPLVDRKEERRSAYRKAFLAYKSSHPLLSQTDIERRGHREVGWLRKHDAAWLRSNRPAASKKGGAPVLDWGARDRAFAANVPAILSQLRREGKRASFSAVGRGLGINLVNVYTKLPQTTALIACRRTQG